MTILVTGGAGYVGSHVVAALVALDQRVVVLDRLHPGRATAVPEGTPLVVGDIRDEGLIRRILRDHRVEAVIHMAAQKSVSASMREPGVTYSTNVGGTLALLDAMVGEGVDRLVFSSTCAVYGTPSSLPVDELTPIRPENPYGDSKAQAESIIRWYGDIHGIRSASLRYFNAAGADPDRGLGEPWESVENLIPRVLRSAADGTPIHVYGTDYPTPDGTAVRDYIHVADLADAHLGALQYLAGGGVPVTLNLGTGLGASVGQVLAAARLVTGRRIDAVDAPRRPGDPAAVWADARRAAQILGWHALRPLEEMLVDAWRWHTQGSGAIPERIAVAR